MLLRFLRVLKHFNGNKPLPREMVHEFEQHFTYYWKNDKNSSIASEDNQKIMRELPVHI